MPSTLPTAPTPAPESIPNHDLATFEKLPAKTQEMELLRDQSEKAIGQDGVAVDQKIQDRSNPDATRPPA
jgi:hypothetical protein